MAENNKAFKPSRGRGGSLAGPKKGWGTPRKAFFGTSKTELKVNQKVSFFLGVTFLVD